MFKWNYSDAKAQLSLIMDEAAAGHPVEITRRGKESAVIISKDLYDSYRKAAREIAYKKESSKSNL